MDCTVVYNETSHLWYHDSNNLNENSSNVFDEFRRWCLDVFKIDTSVNIDSIRVFQIENESDCDNREYEIIKNEEFLSTLEKCDYQGIGIYFLIDVIGNYKQQSNHVTSRSTQLVEISIDLKEIDCKEELIIKVKQYSKLNTRAWSKCWNELIGEIAVKLDDLQKNKNGEWQNEFTLQSKKMSTRGKCGFIKTSDEYCQLLTSVEDSSQKIEFKITVKFHVIY